MADIPLPDRKEIAANLANAQQTVTLLSSQLKAGAIDAGYWKERLERLSELLSAISDEQKKNAYVARLAALAEVSQVLGSSLDTDTVLNQVMDSIIKLTGAERGFLMCLEDDEMDVKVARNLDQEEIAEEAFAISRSVIDLVLENGQAVITTNASNDPRFAEQASVVTYKLRSIQCAPLRIRGDIIGVMYVDNRIRSGVFDDLDLDTLEAFATQAAMAIDNARLFTMTDQALAKRVEELSLLQEIDRQLNETLDFSQTMSLTLEWAMRITEADNGAIALIDLEKGDVNMIAQHGETPAGVMAMLTGEHIDDKSGSLTLPVQREGRVIGVIALDRNDAKPFDETARNFAIRLADHAAISIDNARLYEEVQQANLAKSEFVSVMTHELRIPMTSIKGYAEMMGLVDSLTDQQKKFLEIIENNVHRMSLQVSDLSDIARIESNRLPMEIEDNVAFREALDQVVNSIVNEIELREHNLVIDLPDNLPDVRADPRRLVQIFTNLISNAYKYTPDEGTITVKAGTEDNVVWCEVSDTGVGMTPEEIEKLFTKFWRADNEYVRKQHGTGLGLTIAQNLVEMQDGHLTVSSERDVGTTFRFTLPISG